jgi:hypothetical protein
MGIKRAKRKLAVVRSSKTKRKMQKKRKEPESFADGVLRGLILAEKSARRIARMYGTPIYRWRNGKVVAEKP